MPARPLSVEESVSLRRVHCLDTTRRNLPLLSPCFKTGWYGPFRERLWYERGRRRAAVRGACSPRKPSRLHVVAPQPRSPAGSSWARLAPLHSPTGKPRSPPDRRHASSPAYWPAPLPWQQFQALLTFFSKCFSTFLHSTSTLSVIPSYLALCGTYHTLRPPFPRKPTLRAHRRR